MEDVFEKTAVVMPTYLVAFAVANFTYIEDTANGGLTQKYVSDLTIYDLGLIHMAVVGLFITSLFS